MSPLFGVGALDSKDATVSRVSVGVVVYTSGLRDRFVKGEQRLIYHPPCITPLFFVFNNANPRVPYRPSLGDRNATKVMSHHVMENKKMRMRREQGVASLIRLKSRTGSTAKIEAF